MYVVHALYKVHTALTLCSPKMFSFFRTNKDEGKKNEEKTGAKKKGISFLRQTERNHEIDYLLL